MSFKGHQNAPESSLAGPYSASISMQTHWIVPRKSIYLHNQFKLHSPALCGGGLNVTQSVMFKVSITDATKNICIRHCRINEAFVSTDTQVLYTHCCSFSSSDVYKYLKENVLESSVAYCFVLKVFCNHKALGP